MAKRVVTDGVKARVKFMNRVWYRLDTIANPRAQDFEHFDFTKGAGYWALIRTGGLKLGFTQQTILKADTARELTRMMESYLLGLLQGKSKGE